MIGILRKNVTAGHCKSAFYYTSQLLVLAAPFLIVPFLARVIGPVGLGLYGIGQAIALIVSSLVDYGFQINGTRDVAQNRNAEGVLRRMIGAIVAAKLSVSGVCMLGGLPIVAFVAGSRTEVTVFSLSIVLGVLQGNNFYWYFGGINRLFMAGMIDLIAKLLSLAGIFLLVRGGEDLWLVFAAQIAAQFAAGVFSAALIWMQHGPSLLPRWRGGLALLRANFQVAARGIISIFYVGSTVLVMSFLVGPESVGYFSGAERIIRGAILPMAPLRQTFFPAISAKVALDKHGAARDVRRLLYLVLAINLLITLVFLAAAEPIVRIALGARFAPSAEVLRILSVWPLLSGITEVIGTLWLLPLHFDGAATRVVIVTAMAHLAAVFLFSRLWLYNGAALAMDLSAAVAMIMFCWIAATKAPFMGGFPRPPPGDTDPS